MDNKYMQKAYWRKEDAQPKAIEQKKLLVCGYHSAFERHYFMPLTQEEYQILLKEIDSRITGFATAYISEDYTQQ